MRNPLKTPMAAHIGLLLVRIPIGLIFIAAGIIKFRMGVGTFVTSSIGAAPAYLPEPLARAYLYALPAVEVLLGVMLLIGWFSRLAAFVTALVLISIIMAVTGIWAENSWAPHSNVVLLSIALLLLLTGPGAHAVDSIPFGRVSRKQQPE